MYYVTYIGSKSKQFQKCLISKFINKAYKFINQSIICYLDISNM